MKYIYRLFSVFLSFIMILTAFGLFGVSDSFEVNAGNLLNINTISVGDHIYMGKRNAEGYTGLPYWRVLNVDKNEKTALVISEYLWEGNGKDAHSGINFSDSKNNTWVGSNAQTWCRDFYDNVLYGSRYIAKAEKNDSGYTSKYNFEFGESILNDYVFFLSAEEAEKLFTDDSDRTAYIHDGKQSYSGDDWLLRSPYTWKPYYIGKVYIAGYVSFSDVRSGFRARPACKLDLSEGITASKDRNGDWIINLDNKKKVKTDLATVKMLKPKASKKTITVKWRKISKKNQKKIAKVQIQYSRDKKFKTDVKEKLVSAKKTSYKIKDLKSKKKYYIRIRAYTKAGTTKHVSKWSVVKAVKVK